jgi:hypothetical protein
MTGSDARMKDGVMAISGDQDTMSITSEVIKGSSRTMDPLPSPLRGSPGMTVLFLRGCFDQIVSEGRAWAGGRGLRHCRSDIGKNPAPEALGGASGAGCIGLGGLNPTAHP